VKAGSAEPASTAIGASEPQAEEAELRGRLQELPLAQRHYGYRRLTALLRREGRLVNHKKVQRLLREDNLLAVRRRRFVVTADGRQSWRLWPSLARWMRPDGRWSSTSGRGG